MTRNRQTCALVRGWNERKAEKAYTWFNREKNNYRRESLQRDYARYTENARKLNDYVQRPEV